MLDRATKRATPTAAFSSFSSTESETVQVSGVSKKEPPPVSEGSPHFSKTQYPVCPGPVLMKQAQSTVNVKDIHDFLMRFIVCFFFFFCLPTDPI